MAQVQTIICGWSIRFKEADYSLDELEFLTHEYYKDLVDEITASELDQVAGEAQKHCKFFPKVADLLDKKLPEEKEQTKEEWARSIGVTGPIVGWDK